MADGSVYGCSAYLKDSRFNYGNILEKSFQEICAGQTDNKNIDYIKMNSTSRYIESIAERMRPIVIYGS